MGRLNKRQTQDQGAVKQDNFSGLNNVAPAERLDPSELRKADNIDLSRQGRITRRPGFAEVYAGSGIRSLIAFGPHVLFAEGNILKSLDGSTWLIGIHESNKLAHVIRDDRLFLSDGVANYIADLDGTVAPLSVPTPSRPPVVVSANPPGSGDREAKMRVALTYVDALGQESAASTELEITASAYQFSAVVGSFPAPPSGVSAVRVYATNQDGGTLYLVSEIPASSVDASYTMSIRPDLARGGKLRTQHLTPLPAGHLMAFSRGRLWVAQNNVLWYSEPLYYGLTNPAHNFIFYNKDISVLVGLEEAVIAASDAHYTISGVTPGELRQTKLFGYGAPIGNVVYSEVANLGLDGLGIGAAWMSDEGILVSNAQGAVVNRTNGRVAFPEYDEVATMLREEEGERRLVAVGKSKGQASGFAVTDSWGVEVRRNGVTV